VICLLFDICDLEFLITLRSIKIALTNKSPLVISANIPLPFFLMVIELPLFDFNFSPINQTRWNL